MRRFGADDGVPVVLVHGLGLSTASWGRLPDLLSEFSVWAYDLRGHGDSERARSGGYTLDAHAGDLDAVLAAVHAETRRPVLLLANSFGGAVAFERVRRHDDDVFAIALVGSGASGITVPGLPARGVPDVVSSAVSTGWLQALRLVAVAAKHVRQVEPVADWFVRRAAFTDASPDAVVAHVRRDFFSTDRRALARTTLASVSNNGLRIAPEIDVPVLIVHGECDPEVSNAEVRELVDRLATSELVNVPGGDHMLALTHVELVAAHVRRWTETYRSPSAPAPSSARP